MRGILRKIAAIFWKDLLTELRTKEIFTSVLVFSLLVIVIFNFAFGTAPESTGVLAPGILWVAIAFGGVLGLNRTFSAEKENSHIEGLMLCPADRAVIYWGKLAGSFTFMFVVALIITPVFLAISGFSLLLPRLVLVIVLGVLGFSAAGTLFSAMAVNTHARDIMMPVLLLPVAVPVIVAAVKATAVVFDGGPWSDMSTWLQIIAVFDIIYLVASTLVFEFIIEE